MAKLTEKLVEVFTQHESTSRNEIGPALKRLRELSGLTQKDVANKLGVQQAAVSKAERSGDTHLSTIRKFVEALGASLRVDATFPADTALAINIRDAFDLEYCDDNQLVLPLLLDEPFRSSRDVVLSIKPTYSEKILEGKKTVELRRRFPISAPQGTIAYIYSTSPVRAMVGSTQIQDVIKLPVAQIWKRFHHEAQIKRGDFDRYFEGTEFGFALVFEETRAFSKPLPLSELRARFGFEPPQSFLYAKHDLRRALRNEATVVSN